MMNDELMLEEVALRKESVDRNCTAAGAVCGGLVALRKESVDRNNFCRLHNNVRVMVALRKESVDRNFDDRVALIPHQRRSPQGERG